MIYLKLFYEFAKIGLFSVGGGLATLPFLTDLGNSTGWFTPADLANMLAISESTPGAIGVNMATYVGFHVASLPGAAVATLGLVTPSIAVILVIAHMLKRFQQNRYVQNAFYALRPASTGLIAAAGMGVVSISILTLSDYSQTGNLLNLVNWKALVLAVALFFAMKKIKWHPAAFIAISAVIGIVFHFGS
ncbi:Chromate transporter [Caprobacter fermentans]|uniref:Chromate transporter n=1 Tax=Caproicibacter fermentans TaxID=2576756 RepID=A0A6N8I4P6_9FIRM|nr:chromate transporter [Caproicibacter fermentans]MVB13101.1 Chromate transporter [Caproicibacter fermentans]